MKISADLLKDVGTLMYGRQWQTPMAHVLGVGERSMRRYAHNGIKLDWKRQQKLVAEIKSRRADIVACLEYVVSRPDYGPD